jgi:hypothetical protein
MAIEYIEKRVSLITRAIQLSIFSLFITLSFLFYNCAAQGPPGGGPVDETPPSLVSTYPEEGATNVDTNSELEFIFSEPIDPRSVEGSLTIIPEIKQSPQVKVSRSKITVKFHEPLDKNTTYIVSFGRSVKDYRSNVVSDEIKLAFSTGDSIDEGVITGKVYNIPEKFKSQVWVYRKKEFFPDSLLGAKPDYFAEANERGQYQVTNLPEGEYRLIAVASTSPRKFFIMQDDYLALPQKDPIILKSKTDIIVEVNFFLSKMYIKPFQLLAANVRDSYVELVFSRRINEKCIKNAEFLISDYLSANIVSKWVDESEMGKVYLDVSGLKDKETYKISVKKICDDLDNSLFSSRYVNFIWYDRPDTISPKLISSYPSNRSVDIPLESNIKLNFSEPIKKERITGNIEIYTVDSVNIAFSWEWIDDNSLLLKPNFKLESATQYIIEAVTNRWEDYRRNAFADSIIIINFTTVDVSRFGSISGRVISDKNVNFDELVVEVAMIKNSEYVKRTSLDSAGNFLFPELLEGKYAISIWEDKNKNNKYDKGNLYPFRIAEPYKSYIETIDVRSRWETAGVELVY